MVRSNWSGGSRGETAGCLAVACATGWLAWSAAASGQTYTSLVFDDSLPELIGQVPDLTAGARYLFEDVAGGVDAEVEILTLENGAFLERIDDHGTAAPTDMFYPRLGGNPSQNPRVTFEVRLVDSITSEAEFLDFRWTLADLDSSDGGSGTIFEVGILHDIGNYTLEGNPADPTNLTRTTAQPGVHLFSSNPIVENFDDVDLTDTEVMVLVEYIATSTFRFGFGLEGTQISNTRNVAASGLPSVLDNFADPVETIVPEPGCTLLLGLAALLPGRRRRNGAIPAP